MYDQHMSIALKIMEEMRMIRSQEAQGDNAESDRSAKFPFAAAENKNKHELCWRFWEMLTTDDINDSGSISNHDSF
jgi:hypothetical protein